MSLQFMTIGTMKAEIELRVEPRFVHVSLKEDPRLFWQIEIIFVLNKWKYEAEVSIMEFSLMFFWSHHPRANSTQCHSTIVERNATCIWNQGHLIITNLRRYVVLLKTRFIWRFTIFFNWVPSGYIDRRIRKNITFTVCIQYVPHYTWLLTIPTC